MYFVDASISMFTGSVTLHEQFNLKTFVPIPVCNGVGNIFYPFMFYNLMLPQENSEDLQKLCHCGTEKMEKQI